MGLFQSEIQIVGKPNILNHTWLNINGFDAVRTKLDEGNALTVNNPVVATEQLKQVIIGLS